MIDMLGSALHAYSSRLPPYPHYPIIMALGLALGGEIRRDTLVQPSPRKHNSTHHQGGTILPITGCSTHDKRDKAKSTVWKQC